MLPKMIRKNVVIYFAGKTIPAIVTLLIMVVGIRILGVEEFGRFSLLQNSAMVISTFAVGWVQQGVLRFISSFPDDQKQIAEQKFERIAFLSSIIAAFASFILGYFYFLLPMLSAVIFSLFTLLYSVFAVRLTIRQAYFKATQYAVSESAYYVLTVVFILVLFFVMSIKSSVWIFLSMAISLAAINYYLSRDFFLKQAINLMEHGFLKKIFSYGFPLTMWLFVSGFFNVADRYIIKQFTGFHDVGYYSSVYDLIYKIAGFACFPVILTFHPLIAQKWNQEKKEESMQNVFKAMAMEVVILLIILLFLFLAGDLLIEKILKLNPENARGMYLPLAISAVLWQMVLFVQKPLELMFKQKTLIISIVVSLFSNLLLNWLLIPVYGFTVAAFTTLASTVLYLLCVAVAGYKELSLAFTK